MMMATDISKEIKSEANSGLITRDFLGGCFGIESKELDLDLHVPNGWEKRLDLKSGKVYIQRSNPTNTSSEQRNTSNQTTPKLKDSYTFSQSSNPLLKPTLGLLAQPSLDLNLVDSNSPTTYTSVCTLDKVKSALDRAERASPTSSSSSSSSSFKRRWSMMSSNVIQSLSKSSPPLKGIEVEEERESSRCSDSENGGLLVASACPVCLLYVLISKNDPKCPKCSSLVDLPLMSKKPKIDLNISI